MIRTVRTFLPALFAFTLSFAPTVFGQGGVATGDLRVTVKDPKGNVVTTATVTVRDLDKGLERTGTSDGQGGYSVRLLPPATYSVAVEATGFANAEAKNVSITVGGLVDLPIVLTLASGKEVVEVNAEAELVETSRSSTTDTIGQRRIDNLPINGRNYINFTLTDSQVVRDNAPSIGIAPTSGLNMSGQRARSNLVNVDGADATENSVNGVRATVSQEAVQEFQIITNSYAAEYGRASGGVVNIITRSGSNEFHGDVFGYLRNRNFQAVNPFSTVRNPAYTRVQAGAAFGGPIKKDKTYFYFAYEITRRHETGFSSIGQDCLTSSGQLCFGLAPFDTTTVALPFGTVQLTSGAGSQIAFLTNPAVLAAESGNPAYANEVAQYVVLAGASSGQAVNGVWPSQLVAGATGGALTRWAGFPTTCQPGSACAPVPSSYQTLASEIGNFPVFQGVSIYSLRLDHNINLNNRVSLRASVSPSTTTGIEVSGQNQPFGQNAYSRTSQETLRDVAGVAQDTWTIGNNKVNELRFQYARRGRAYFYNTLIPGGSDVGVNIPGFAYFGREPYSFAQYSEQRYQFTDNFSWTIGRHNTKFGVDFNYLPINAVFAVNYGGRYDFGTFIASNLGFVNPAPGTLPDFPQLSPVQSYGAGLPGDLVQGLGDPKDSFSNKSLGAFWQDSWRVNNKVTLNYGLRYDIEFPPTLKPITSTIAQSAYSLLGLQKGIKTATHDFQPRIGVAVDPNGDGKTVLRASYGMFYDHPLLGLYFLGDASDGSTSGQLAFGGTALCSNPSGLGNPANLNAFTIFQGLPINATSGPCSVSANPTVAGLLGYSPSQQLFSCASSGTSCGVASTTNSIFLNQNYLNPSTFLPLGQQPFGYPQAKNFVYAYSQQANLTVERDLGAGFALSVAYNFNGGRHLNRPINANTIRGDLMVSNLNAAIAAGQSFASPFTVSGCGTGSRGPYVDSSLMNFFRPGGLNPSIALVYDSPALGSGACVALANQILQGLASQGFNAKCNELTLAGCVPFGDMDANYSNGSSIYHGFTTNLRKRFSNHFEFLTSYTWSHSIDDSVDVQSTTTPQDSFFPGAERSTSLFDQRHRFVFSGVYQTGHMSGSFAHSFFSDWTFAPLIDVASGRPFNIITGNGDNLQLSGLTGRPNTVVNPICTAVGNTPVASKFSPTAVLQEPCIQAFVFPGPNPTLQQLDGNLARNAGLSPWTLFNDLRVSKRVYFTERFSMDLIADIFNIANRYNVQAVNPLFTNAGQPTAAYDPRQFQFAMKFNW
jgi:hypothetical protein